jgi:hypothetical protein
MRFVGLLVIVWPVVGAIAAGQRGVLHPRFTKLCQRRNDHADRGRGAAQLRGCQSESDELQCAPTQWLTPTAQFQPI